MKRTDPLTAAAWLGVGAATANVVYAVAFDAVVVPAAGSWWRLAAMALFSAGAFAAMLAGLQRVGAVRNAIIGVMEPLTVAVLAAAFLNEPLTLPVVAGGTLILGGAVMASLIRTREPRSRTCESPHSGHRGGRAHGGAEVREHRGENFMKDEVVARRPL